MTWKLTRTAGAAVLVFIVVTLTAVGSLNNVPLIVRALIQGAVLVVGIYLGSQWQLSDIRRDAEASAKTAVRSQIAMATNIKHLLAGMDSFNTRLSESPPATTGEYEQASNGYFSAADVHIRGILAQAETAAETWLNFLPDDDPFRRSLDQTRTTEEGDSEQ